MRIARSGQIRLDKTGSVWQAATCSVRMLTLYYQVQVGRHVTCVESVVRSRCVIILLPSILPFSPEQY